MRYVVLAIVGFWFAYQTTYLFIPVWNSPSLFAHALIIGFGYTVFLLTLIDQCIPRPQTTSYLLFCGLLTVLGYLIFRSPTPLMLLTIAWLGYGLLLISIRLKIRLGV